ncbi:MAG TPA: hypothetical protein VK013_03420 [Myxococcaceae bacterium]|nr:hypothetical protein [Myxococcaceae bacterium]
MLLGALALVACGDARLVQIEPPDDETLYDDGPPSVAVSGQARIFPPAHVWLEARDGVAPVLEAERVVVADPLQQALGEETDLPVEAPLEATGAFRIPAVGVSDLVLGLGGTVGASPGLAPVTSLIYDAAQEGTRPREDLEGVWIEAVPLEWLWALEAGVGAERLAAWAPEAVAILDAGLILGRVLGADGEPVAGARLRVHPPELQERLVYPHADLEDVGLHATDASGLFVLVHDGGDVRTLSLTLEDAPDVLPHHGVLAPGSALLLQLRPPP